MSTNRSNLEGDQINASKEGAQTSKKISRYIEKSSGLQDKSIPLKYKTLHRSLTELFLNSLQDTSDFDPTKLANLLTDFSKTLQDFINKKGSGNIVIDYQHVYVILLEFLQIIVRAVTKPTVISKYPKINQLYTELMEYLQKHCTIKESKGQTTKFFTAFSSITKNCYVPLHALAIHILNKREPNAVLTNEENNQVKNILKIMGEMLSSDPQNFSKVDSLNQYEVLAMYYVMIRNLYKARIFIDKIESIVENNVLDAQKLELIPLSMGSIYTKLVNNLENKGALEEAIAAQESFLNHLEWNHNLLKNQQQRILEVGSNPEQLLSLSEITKEMEKETLVRMKYRFLQTTELLKHFNENKFNISNCTLILKNNDDSLLFVAILKCNDIKFIHIQESKEIVIYDLHLVNIQDLMRAFADYKLALSEINLSPEDQFKKKTEDLLLSIFNMKIEIPEELKDEKAKEENQPKDIKTDAEKAEEMKEGEQTKTQNSENKKKKKKKKGHSNESKQNQPVQESKKEKQNEIQPKLIFGGTHTYFNNPAIKKTLNPNTVFKIHGGTPRHYIRVSQAAIDKVNDTQGINIELVFNWMLSMLDRGKIATDKGFICAENSALAKDESKGLRMFGTKEEVIIDSNKKQHTIYVITSIEGKNWKTAKGLRGDGLELHSEEPKKEETKFVKK